MNNRYQGPPYSECSVTMRRVSLAQGACRRPDQRWAAGQVAPMKCQDIFEVVEIMRDIGIALNLEINKVCKKTCPRCVVCFRGITENPAVLWKLCRGHRCSFSTDSFHFQPLDAWSSILDRAIRGGLLLKSGA